MYNPFTKHPRECVDETWLQHCKFTMILACRLYVTSWIFVIHGIFPFIPIPKWLNLEESIRFLERENEDREIKHQEVIKCVHCNRNDGTCGCGKKPDCNIGCEIGNKE